MNFTISVDTGNIELDVWNTIANFSDEQVKQFIEAIGLKKHNSNIVGKSIVFRYSECEKILAGIDKPTQVSTDIRKILREKTYRLDTEIFLLKNFELKNIESLQLQGILEKINKEIDVRKKFVEALTNDKYNYDFYDTCFEIISNDELFDKFLKYDENIKMFDKNFTQEDYLLELSKILGNKSEEICISNPIYRYQILNQTMLDRYTKLRKLINVDIKILGDEPFGTKGTPAYTKEEQQRIDNDWELNQEVLDYVMNDMDPEYNLEEQICHIYIKLCCALRYNTGYRIYKYETKYDKKRQEAITLQNNEVICSEFVLACTNIISRLSEHLEVRCIRPQSGAHVSLGILIKEKNIRIDLDSTKLEESLDDLARVKIGLPLKGIEYISDRKNEFKTAFEKVYNKFMQEQKIETEDLIAAYEKMSSKQTIPIEFRENMNEFIKKMQTKQIKGSELLATFIILTKKGYFGDIKFSIVAEATNGGFEFRAESEGTNELLDGIEENVIINNNNEYYLFKLNTCEIIPTTPSKLNELFEMDMMKYFSKKYSLDGIGKTKSI